MRGQLFGFYIGMNLFLFLRRKQGVNWVVRGTLACLASLFFYVYHKTNPVVFFFLKMASPIFLLFLQNTQPRPTCFVSPAGLQIFQDEEMGYQ